MDKLEKVKEALENMISISEPLTRKQDNQVREAQEALAELNEFTEKKQPDLTNEMIAKFCESLNSRGDDKLIERLESEQLVDDVQEVLSAEYGLIPCSNSTPEYQEKHLKEAAQAAINVIKEIL